MHAVEEFSHAAPRSWALSVAAARATLIVGASLAMGLGILVYLLDRPPGHAALISPSLALGTGPVFGALGGWLPSFVHPFAFSLWWAELRTRTQAPIHGVCATWWLLNVVFELGQHPQIRPLAVEGLQRVFGQGWPVTQVSNYLLRGTFDLGDLIAATFGAVAAALVHHLIHRKGGSHVH